MLPANLESLLMDRIDRLDEEPKSLLQAASVIGRRLARFLFETGYAHVFAARQDVGVPLLERALAIGEASGDDEAVGYASMGLVWHHAYWGSPGPQRTDTAKHLGNRALEIGRRLEDVWLVSKTLLALASEFAIWGRPGEAAGCDQELLELAKSTGDPRPHALAMYRLAYGAGFTGQFEAAIDYADAAIREAISPIDRAYGYLSRGFALLMSGRASESLEQIADLRGQTEANGMVMVNFLTNEVPYGLGLVFTGEIAKGVRSIEDAMERFTGLGQATARAYGHLYLGQVYLNIATSAERPPAEVVRRNLGFLLRTVPFAARIARKHLERGVAECRRLDLPYPLAETLLQLARLHRAKKRVSDAQACFDKAREIAESIGVAALVDRIEVARDEQPG